jgi:hypothetical protein
MRYSPVTAKFNIIMGMIAIDSVIPKEKPMPQEGHGFQI